MAGFEQSITGRERIVEDRIVGEVAHREIIDLPNRARMPLARRVDALDSKFSREHAIRLNETSGSAACSADFQVGCRVGLQGHADGYGSSMRESWPDEAELISHSSASRPSTAAHPH